MQLFVISSILFITIFNSYLFKLLIRVREVMYLCINMQWTQIAYQKLKTASVQAFYLQIDTPAGFAWCSILWKFLINCGQHMHLFVNKTLTSVSNP